MIFKRFAANLRAQNWSAILIELGIVILGVFIGTLVANANQQRLEGAEAGYRLKQLKPELQRIRARADVAAAALLRAHPDLVQDLQWHLAAEAALIGNLAPFEQTTANLKRRIAKIDA